MTMPQPDHPKRSMLLRLINKVGRPLTKNGFSFLRLDEKTLLDKACAQTGLEDFGAQDFRERLAVILQSLAEDRDLSPLGRMTYFAMLVRFAANRLRIEDLLRRDPVHFSPEQMPSYLTGEIVLVTGAGGSIGSELCRQIGPQGPAALLLLGHGENSIYEIERELRLLQEEGVGQKTTIVPIIAAKSVREYAQVRRIAPMSTSDSTATMMIAASAAFGRKNSSGVFR